jgi:hypothetical protein
VLLSLCYGSGLRAGEVHRAGAPAARRAGALRTARYLRGPSGRRTPHAATTVPRLRRTHVHHRDLRARQRAKASINAGGRDQDRHHMMPSSLIQHRTEARHSGRLSPGPLADRHPRCWPHSSSIRPPRRTLESRRWRVWRHATSCSFLVVKNASAWTRSAPTRS